MTKGRIPHKHETEKINKCVTYWSLKCISCAGMISIQPQKTIDNLDIYCIFILIYGSEQPRELLIAMWLLCGIGPFVIILRHNIWVRPFLDESFSVMSYFMIFKIWLRFKLAKVAIKPDLRKRWSESSPINLFREILNLSTFKSHSLYNSGCRIKFL